MSETVDVKTNKINNIKILLIVIIVVGASVFISLKSKAGADRIVYGTSPTNVSKYESDCKVKGGKFNECGIGCEKAPCTDDKKAVCYYTCEFR